VAKQDTYQIITSSGKGEFKDRGSKFLGFAHPALSEKDALAKVEEYHKLHHKARHWCYAYRIGPDQNRFRANDDGEPSGTAGRPILGQIDKLEASDVVVIVVRYFGGVKLGTSGLINAYREAAALALAESSIGEKVLTHSLQIHFTYELMGKVMNALNSLGLAMASQDFGDQPSLFIEVPRSEASTVKIKLLAHIGEVYLEEVDEKFTVEGLTIDIINQ